MKSIDVGCKVTNKLYNNYYNNILYHLFNLINTQKGSITRSLKSNIDVHRKMNPQCMIIGTADLLSVGCFHLAGINNRNSIPY